MEKKIEKLLNNTLTLSEFLKDDEKDLELTEVQIDAENSTLEIKYGSDGEVFKKDDLEFAEQHSDNGQALTDVLIDLKKHWNMLLNDEHYFGDLDEFMNKFKLTVIDINLQDEEVRFESGKYHLVEGLDLNNQ